MDKDFAYVTGTCPECGAPTTARLVDRRLNGRTVRIGDRRRCTALGSCGWTEPTLPGVRVASLLLAADG